jgi:hypothetical protein
MHQLGHVVERSELNLKYERRGGLPRLGAAQRIFATVVGERLRKRSTVVAVDGKKLVLAAAEASDIEDLRALEQVLLPALSERLPGPSIGWVHYMIDPDAKTPTMGRVERARRAVGPPSPEAEETAARLPAGPLRERFTQWMTLTMESGKERL